MALVHWILGAALAAAQSPAPPSRVPIVAAPLADGAVVPIAGTRIRFSRAKGKWTATVLDGFGSEPRLHCSGSVAEVGDTFTILGAGAQAEIARSSLPPAN